MAALAESTKPIIKFLSDRDGEKVTPASGWLVDAVKTKLPADCAPEEVQDTWLSVLRRPLVPTSTATLVVVAQLIVSPPVGWGWQGVGDERNQTVFMLTKVGVVKKQRSRKEEGSRR